MTRVVHRLRWRLAQAVAPTDIVAGPGHDGPALLVREPGDPALSHREGGHRRHAVARRCSECFHGAATQRLAA